MRWGGYRSGAHDFFRNFGPRRRRPNPGLALWRWRWEVGALLGVPSGLVALGEATDPVVSVAVGVSAAAIAAAWRPARFFLTEHARCIVVQHRLRVGWCRPGSGPTRGGCRRSCGRSRSI